MEERFSHALNRPQFCLLGFCLGVAAVRLLPALPPLTTVYAIAVPLVLTAIYCRGVRAVAAFAVGVCWAATVATATLGDELPRQLEKKDVRVCGRVLGLPAVAGRFQRFDFQPRSLSWRGRDYPPPGKIRLRIFSAEPLIRSGSHWCFTARLKQARGYQNPGMAFNYETYLLHHRLRASGYVRARPAPVLVAAGGHSIHAFRRRVADFIHTAAPNNPRAGVLAALVVGARDRISRPDWEILARTGTIHLMAISGLHIGLVSGLFMLLGGGIWRLAGGLSQHLPAPKFGILVGLLAGLVYALLAGMTIPTQRAVCMLAVVAVAIWRARPAFRFDTWLLALTAVLMVDPLAVLSAGFYLSFGAVLILLFSAGRGRARYPARHDDSWLRRLRQRGARATVVLWQCQIILFIGMAPLLFALFHRVSLIAPFANMIAIPIIGMLVVPAGLLGLGLYALGWPAAAAAVFRLAVESLDQVWNYLEILAAAPWAVWLQSPPVWSLPLAAVGVWILLSGRAMFARGAGLLWLAPLFSAADAELSAGEYRYTMLEVGNGLASVVRTARHVLVYDAGPKYAGGFDSGEQVVAPFLRKLGARRIDAMVISHGDNDHAGGYGALRAQYDIRKVFTSAPAVIADARPCRSGQRWHWDGVTFEILWPRTSARGDNDASCVLRVHSRYGALLLSGDIGKRAEAMLGVGARGLTADVLQVPHHGSKTSSTDPFLRRVRPRAALVSAGYLNQHRHPHDSVRARYAELNIPLYLTAEEGAIDAEFLRTGIWLNGQRSKNQQYWVRAGKQLAAPLRLNTARDAQSASNSAEASAHEK